MKNTPEWLELALIYYYEAFANRYGELRARGLIAATGKEMLIALSLHRMVSEGRLEEFLGPDGKICYRSTSNMR
jgi:hypothetical protein